MNTLEVRLEQNRKDQQKLKEEENKILQEVEESKPKWEFWRFGDIAKYDGCNTRYLLTDASGDLAWFSKETGQYTFSRRLNKIELQAEVNKYKKVGSLFEK